MALRLGYSDISIAELDKVFNTEVPHTLPCEALDAFMVS